MQPLLDMVLESIPGPEVDPDAPLQMLVTTLDWSEFVGRIAIGRITGGHDQEGPDGRPDEGGRRASPSRACTQLYTFDKLGRVEVDEVTAGDVCAVVGIEDVEIGDTICHREHHRPLARLHVDEPTLEMVFTINSSPVRRPRRQVRHQPPASRAAVQGAGAERRPPRAADRRQRRLRRLRPRRAAPVGADREHAPRRLRAVGRQAARSFSRTIDGETHEPFESLVVEVPSDKLGSVMELVGAAARRAGRDARPRRLHARPVHHSGPRADRPAHAAAQRHAGHGRHSPPLRRLQADDRRSAAAGQRRVHLDGHRPGQRLRPEHAAGAGRPVRHAQRRGLRRA